MAVKAQFIAGQWLPGSGATMSKLAPEDQSLLWQAASAGADDVQAACAAARAAFYPRSHRPLAERIDVVQRFAALLETHKEALATLISTSLDGILTRSLLLDDFDMDETARDFERLISCFLMNR